VKELARAFCPPIVWRSIAGLRRLAVRKRQAAFSGVFEHFESVEDQRPWIRAGYQDVCRGLLRECKEGAIPPGAATSHSLLAFMINTLPGKSAPKILDWAGGTGLRYWTTRPALNRSVRWQVVDNPALASISTGIMGTSDELMFAETLQLVDSPTVDIVLVYSSLQYVDAQGELLATLAGFRPRYIVFPRLMALRDASYVTRQNVQGFDTPCRVSDLTEIVDSMTNLEYEVVLMIQDGIDLSPMFGPDVPDHLRVRTEWLLVFRSLA